MLKANDRIKIRIGDYFEQLLKSNNIPFQIVGDLHIPYGERQEDYLDDSIAKEIKGSERYEE